MRVLHVATHERSGAGRSAVRIHRALRKQGVQSEMLVLRHGGTEPGVSALGGAMRGKLSTLQRHAEEAMLSLQSTGDGGYRSLGLWGGGLAGITGSDADVVHLHWIPGLLAIGDLPRIDRPVVWTFHDEWPICGAEHYTDLARHRTGYEAANRALADRGPDLDGWTWRRKRACWPDFKPHIVCPSQWLAEEVRGSVLFGDRKVDVVRYPLDTSLFQPQERVEARTLLGLPAGRSLLLFGALDPTGDRRKGIHVLSDALRRLADRGAAGEVELVVFGASGGPDVHGFRTHWMGFVDDEASLGRIYAACDAFVIPSLQDNLPNTMLEAMACGLPVVGSDTGGIPDLVRHMETGLLSAPGDAAQLADRLELLLRDAALRSRLGQEARRAVERACDEGEIAARYAEIYRSTIPGRSARQGAPDSA